MALFYVKLENQKIIIDPNFDQRKLEFAIPEKKLTMKLYIFESPWSFLHNQPQPFPLINSHQAINTNIFKNSGYSFEDKNLTQFQQLRTKLC